jgi:predicted nucleic acid-binding protein
VTVGHPLRDKILSRVQQGDEFAIIAVVLNEFLFGIASVPRASMNQQEWEHLKPAFKYLAVDAADAEAAVKLRLHLRRQGYQLGLTDSFIAVAALQHGCTLLTTDADFRSIPELQQENWRV